MSIQRIIIPRFIKRKQSHKTVYIKKQWSANRQENCHTLVCLFFFFKEKRGFTNTVSSLLFYLYCISRNDLGRFQKKKKIELEGRDDFSTQQNSTLTCSFYCSESTCIKDKESQEVTIFKCGYMFRAILWL